LRFTIFREASMEKDHNEKIPVENKPDPQDCGCEGNCCPPKKNNLLTKVIFMVVVLMAIGIIAVKLFHHSDPVAEKQTQCTPGSGCCDTVKAASCDTTKGSSCCPKK